MPLLNIKTNIKLSNKTAFAELASRTVAEITGKPESYVMVSIEDNQCLMFGANHQPCALLNIKSLGLAEDKTSQLSEQLCEFIQSNTNINPARIYIEFSNPQRHMWGWDKKTF